MTSASHAEGRQFDPGQVYFSHCVPSPSKGVLVRAHPDGWQATEPQGDTFVRGEGEGAKAPCGDRAHDHTLTKRMLYQLS